MNSVRRIRVDLGICHELAEFLEKEVLIGPGITPDTFWAGLSTLVRDFGIRNRALLEKRAALQCAIVT